MVKKKKILNVDSILNELSKNSDKSEVAKLSTAILDELLELTRTTKAIRQKSIVALSKSGMTYDQIGELLGLTKGRVYQILKGQSGDTGKYYANE